MRDVLHVAGFLVVVAMLIAMMALDQSQYDTYTEVTYADAP